MENPAVVAFKEDLDAMFIETRGGVPPLLKTAPQKKSVPKPQARTVLVVDDNKDYRELVKHLLSIHNYNVLEAGNGEEALSVINTLCPDLALVDFNMPKMNGYELIQELRSNYDTRKLRIIMFTGASNRQHLRTLTCIFRIFFKSRPPTLNCWRAWLKLSVYAPRPRPGPGLPGCKLSVSACPRSVPKS